MVSDLGQCFAQIRPQMVSFVRNRILTHEEVEATKFEMTAPSMLTRACSVDILGDIHDRETRNGKDSFHIETSDFPSAVQWKR